MNFIRKKFQIFSLTCGSGNIKVWQVARSVNSTYVVLFIPHALINKTDTQVIIL